MSKKKSQETQPEKQVRSKGASTTPNTSPSISRVFASSILSLLFGLILAAFWIYQRHPGHQPPLSSILSGLFVVFVLSVLEISLSVDNAVVNASVLARMTPVWQKRFLTWGLLIAVFGMRIVFPVLIVALSSHVSWWDAISIAVQSPDKYAELMHNAHTAIAAFGGAFLFMVALKYFLDANKDEHWIRILEKPLVRLGRLEAIEIAITLALLIILSSYMHTLDQKLTFLVSGLWGCFTFILVDGIGAFLEAPDMAKHASLGLFLYLEVLDASFSFDGVIGALAISHDIVIIAIGLGVGAMFVRSLTIYLVQKGMLTQFRYLEHGAFYAIGALACIMFIELFYEVHEAITGLIGAGFIAFSLWSSWRLERHQK